MIVGQRSGGAGLPILLVGVALAAMLLLAVHQVLVANGRVSAMQWEASREQQAVRAAVDLMAHELREASASRRDLITFGEQSISFRSYGTFGIVCEVLAEDPIRVAVGLEGASFKVGQDIVLLLDGDPRESYDDRWLATKVTETSEGGSCGEGGFEAQELTLAERSVGGVHPGAVIRGWRMVRYGVDTLRGQPYLVRESSQSRSPLSGPLAPNGLEIQYLDRWGYRTSDPGCLHTVRITLRTRGSDEEYGIEGDSTTTTVFLRN